MSFCREWFIRTNNSDWRNPKIMPWEGFVKPNFIMNKVRAKFVCTGVEDQPFHKQKAVSFSAVTSGSEENKSFAKYTPFGNLQMWISYETRASDAFEQGKEYYLDISPVE